MEEIRHRLMIGYFRMELRMRLARFIRLGAIRMGFSALILCIVEIAYMILAASKFKNMTNLKSQLGVESAEKKT